MGYAIFRIEKRKSNQSIRAMLQHALREVIVPNSVPGAPAPAILFGESTTEAALRRLANGIARAKARGGSQGFTKASTRGLDILVAFSPEDAIRLGAIRQEQYFRLALAFISENFGGADNILTAAVHRDETTPHMQVLVMPLDQKTNRFSASRMIGGPIGLRNLQDQFHSRCGAPVGLERGVKGSKARHVPVRKLYAWAAASPLNLPTLREVPAAPSIFDRLSPDLGVKKKLHDDAIRHNELAQKDLTALAKIGVQMHPVLVARMAERYRLASDTEKTVRLDLERLEREKRRLENIARSIKQDRDEMQQLARSAGELWKRAGAQSLIEFSSHFDQETADRVGSQFKVKLNTGTPLLEQLHAQGVGGDLIGASKLLINALRVIRNERNPSANEQREYDSE
jgi:hypothetical protein